MTHSSIKNQALQYIRRTRDYYEKLGYKKPYRWAEYDTVPFTILNKPLSECTVGIVTTAAPYDPEKGDQGPHAPYNAKAKFFDVYEGSTDDMPDLRISHVAYDRDHTFADDIGAYFPLNALRYCKQQNAIGELSQRFYGLPTNRSIRTTIETDCQILLKLCQKDSTDIALLIPNCPVCHQSVSLAARTLESAGIVTVVMGCAKDIVEHVGVPRFLFSDFPLGNAAGIPNNIQCQRDTTRLALELAASATQARTTEQSPYRWHGSENWKNDYSNADRLSAAEIAARRELFDKGKDIAKQKRAGYD